MDHPSEQKQKEVLIGKTYYIENSCLGLKSGVLNCRVKYLVVLMMEFYCTLLIKDS